MNIKKYLVVLSLITSCSGVGQSNILGEQGKSSQGVDVANSDPDNKDKKKDNKNLLKLNLKNPKALGGGSLIKFISHHLRISVDSLTLGYIIEHYSTIIDKIANYGRLSSEKKLPSEIQKRIITNLVSYYYFLNLPKNLEDLPSYFLLSKVQNNEMLYNMLLNALGEYPNTISINQLSKDGNTVFICAIKEDNLYVISRLLDDPRIDVNQVNRNGDTPLIYAIKENKLDAMELLLANSRVDVNQVSRNGDTPLTCAIEENKLDAMELLLAHPKIDVNQLDSDRNAPLLYAMSLDKTNPTVIKLLLAHPNIDLLHYNGKKAPRGINFVSPLEALLSRESVELCDLELEAVSTVGKILMSSKKIDPNAYNKQSGLPILILAIDKYVLESIHQTPGLTSLLGLIENMLSDERIDVNTPDINGYTPINFAVNFSSIDVVKLILDSGKNVDLDREDNTGISAYKRAKSKDDPKILNMFNEYIQNQLGKK